MRGQRGLWRFVLPLALLLAGCQKGTGMNKAEPELPDWLTEDAKGSTNPQAEAIFDQLQQANLGLNLTAGDRFPLRKVVEQELSQDSLSGLPQVSRSRLEVMFAISVADRQADRTKLDVRYERVKYTHDVAGEHANYDSTNPPQNVPLAVRAYHDMVGEGFSFWLGADNQIVEVEGFTDFLNRCLRNVPETHRQSVILGIEAGSGETGIANFVDNSIGLLPYGNEQTPGDSWERTLHIGRPVPMHVRNVYTLKELTQDTAVIDIRGSIAPSTTMSSIEDGSGVRVSVTGGETLGRCTVFRDTGLPRESRVERNVQMSVMLSNSLQFNQRKRVTTTIESFPASSSAPTFIGQHSPAATGGSLGAIAPASLGHRSDSSKQTPRGAAEFQSAQSESGPNPLQSALPGPALR